MGKKTKQAGKTEVYPFWYMEDIKNMMDYFKMKKMWHWYLAFNFGLLLGRRVSDTLSMNDPAAELRGIKKPCNHYFNNKSYTIHPRYFFRVCHAASCGESDPKRFKWSDFFYENGRMRDEIEIKEQKTGKITRPYVCGACKKALELYIEKTGVDPMENYNDFIITTAQKSQLLENKKEYSGDEWNELFWKATQSQAAAFRKQFKIAADACAIQYAVSTHSLRKSFGFWSVKLHPYDVTTVDKLQGIFSHSDRNTTLHYIGIAREDEIKLYNDMGDFITDVSNGKKPVIKNSPVVSLKADDFREILSKCWDMAQNGEDKFSGINNLIGLAEKCMV